MKVSYVRAGSDSNKNDPMRDRKRYKDAWGTGHVRWRQTGVMGDVATGQGMPGATTSWKKQEAFIP